MLAARILSVVTCLALVSAAAVAAPPAKSGQAKPKLQPASVQKPTATSETRPSASYFLASSPHVPLAVVERGELRSAVPPSDRKKRCGVASRWAKEGSTWHALDAWGQIAGLATVEILDEYEATRCTEVSFAPKFDQNSERYVFVSSDSAYRPAPSFEWKPAWNTQAKFKKALAGTLAEHSQKHVPYECSDGTAAVRYFKYTRNEQLTYVAIGGGNGGYLLATFDPAAADPAGGKGLWSTARVYQGKSESCYRPVSVLDMNGDGTPEVVMRNVDDEGDTWRDSVLSLSAGRWTLAAVSPGGGTL